MSGCTDEANRHAPCTRGGSRQASSPIIDGEHVAGAYGGPGRPFVVHVGGQVGMDRPGTAHPCLAGEPDFGCASDGRHSRLPIHAYSLACERVLFGLWPALQSSKASVSDALKAEGS